MALGLSGIGYVQDRLLGTFRSGACFVNVRPVSLAAFAIREVTY